MDIDLYVDMDGTLAYFNKNIDCYERLFEKNYFYNLPPIENLVSAINLLLDIKDDNINVYILSACVNDDAIVQKDKWIDKYLPLIPMDNRIYVEVGVNKSDYIKDKKNMNILLDDYNKNLLEFHDGNKRIGIKFVNDINDINKTWDGQRVDYRTSSIELMHQIRSLALKEVFKHYDIPNHTNTSLHQRMERATQKIVSRDTKGSEIGERNNKQKDEPEINK